MAGRFYTGQPKGEIDSENLPFLKEFLSGHIFSWRYVKRYALLGINLRFNTVVLRDSSF